MNKAQHDLSTNHQRAHSMPAGAFHNGQIAQQKQVSFSTKRRHPSGINEALTFGTTQTHVPIYQQDQSTLCQVELRCKVDRGFFLSSQHWTCYRRNYFQLTGAFTTHCNENQVFYIRQHPDSNGSSGEDSIKEESTKDSLLIPIQAFFIRIVANTSDNNQPVELIQLTAKRDKGPQQMPSMLPIQPCGGGLLLHYPHDTNSQQQRTVTYERLQFKSATANNGKKRATQQYFYLTAQLVAQDVNRYQHVIATTQSSPLVVRGRSPGHYAEMDQRQTLTATNKRKKVVSAEEDKPDLNAPLSPSSLSPIPMTTQPTSSPSPTHSASPPTVQPTIVTPTIPSDSSSMYYMAPPFHSRSFSANDSAWQLPQRAYPYYRPTSETWTWNHPPAYDSSAPSSSKPDTKPPTFMMYPNTPWDARDPNYNQPKQQ